MLGRTLWPFLLIALWLVIPLPATAQTYPDERDPYVNDYADLLDDAQETDLRRKLIDLWQHREIEMTVLTIERRSDYTQNTTNETFATNLFNHWGIGDGTHNNGVLFLVSRFDRDMRIEVGRGYGTIKDAALKDIIDSIVIPYFKADRYADGITFGVDHTIREIAGVWPDQYDANAVTRLWTDLNAWLGGFIFVVLAPIGWAIYRSYRAAQRRRPRRCPIDGSWMPRVLEEFEDKHLNAGQQKEEELASKEYDVWVCRTCNHVTIEGFQRWFSKQKLCKNCGFHTLESYSNEITEQPTQHSSGTKRTDFRCNHCNQAYPIFTTLPMISDSSSSGGSSGGGSSSGGGASGSW